MKVFITGGTGFLGAALTERFLTEGHSVTILTRSAENRDHRPGLTYSEGNPTRSGPWQEEVSGHDVVVNLAGGLGESRPRPRKLRGGRQLSRGLSRHLGRRGLRGARLLDGLD